MTLEQAMKKLRQIAPYYDSIGNNNCRNTAKEVNGAIKYLLSFPEYNMISETLLQMEAETFYGINLLNIGE